MNTTLIIMAAGIGSRFGEGIVSALSKGGFSIHINPVIMIARC